VSRAVHYLDYAATAFPKAPGVADAVARFLEHDAGNPGRGGHRLTVAASRTIEAAREEVAALLGGDPERTLLGPGATFWLNTVLWSRLGPGARIVTSALEHNAVMRPLRALERERGIDVVVAPGAHPHGVPTAAEVAAVVAAAPTALVVLTHASNVSGAVLPVAEIAHAVAPAPVLVDGAQSAGSLPFHFAGSGLAAYACSGHKGLLGPPGTGVLLLAPGFDVEPLVHGGTGSNSESEELPSWLPDRLEAGTANGPGLAGLGAACRWLAERGIAALHDHATGLAGQLADRLRVLPGVRLVGHDEASERVAIVSFSVDGRDAGELAAWLDRERGLLLRAGLHCAPAAHRRLGTFPDGALRAGFGPLSSAAAVDELVAALREVVS
jgi:selenocysteine lyase/cysteine desulfurase